MVPAILFVFTKVCGGKSPVPLVIKPEIWADAVAVHCTVTPETLNVNATATLLPGEQTVCDKELLVIAGFGFTVII